jgi:hypothetical protein
MIGRAPGKKLSKGRNAMTAIAIGAQVYARKDGTVTIVPPETEYQPQPDETRLAEIVNIDIRMHCGEVVKATIECYPNEGTVLQAIRSDIHFKRFFEGPARRIKKVIFEDLTTWEMGSDQ